jgi:integrase
MSLAALCERYRGTYQHWKPKTLTQKDRIVNRIISDWPTGKFTPIGKIRPSDCNLWLARLRVGVADRNGHLWLLKDMFAMATRDQALGSSPAEHLKPQKRPDPIRRTPTIEQFRAILASVRSQKYNGHNADDSADFLEAEGLLGLGQAELSGITRSDVDLERGQISVLRRKTSKRFVIPIYADARPLLERVCKGKLHRQKIFGIADAKKALAAACDRLNIPRFSQRSFRRMFITHAIECGIDPKVIAEWQGHVDGGVLILKTYSHVRRPHSHAMATLMKWPALEAEVLS